MLYFPIINKLNTHLRPLIPPLTLIGPIVKGDRAGCIFNYRQKARKEDGCMVLETQC
jgi:hypothetical protein